MSDRGIEARFSGELGAFTLDAAFTAPAQGVTALFGHSGSGKTTVLRCLAGLHRLPGRLTVAGEVWQDERVFKAVHERPIGYVFQEASLFPHMTVGQNLLYGRKRAGKRAEAVDVDDVIGMLGLEGLIGRAPDRLSGGERQRVAIGRALLTAPRLLLMDEPLSALDRFSKEDILPFLERLHGHLSIPVVYVSHDIAEVERLADTLVLMDKGRVVARGPVAEVAADLDLPLARAGEAASVLEAECAGFDEDYGLSCLTVDGGELCVPADARPLGTRLRIRVLAVDVSLALSPSDSTISNVLPARIRGIQPHGAAQLNVRLGLGETGEGASLLARVTRRSWDRLGLAEGMAVHAQVKSVALVERGGEGG